MRMTNQDRAPENMKQMTRKKAKRTDRKEKSQKAAPERAVMLTQYKGAIKRFNTERILGAGLVPLKFGSPQAKPGRRRSGGQGQAVSCQAHSLPSPVRYAILLSG